MGHYWDWFIRKYGVHEYVRVRYVEAIRTKREEK